MKRTKTIIAALFRTLLGLVFIFSGAVKAIDPLGTVYKIEDYLKAFGNFFLDLLPAAEVAAWSLIVLELLLGVCMLLNVRSRWTSCITLLFYLVMTPLTLYIAINNPVSDCGCYRIDQLANILEKWGAHHTSHCIIRVAQKHTPIMARMDGIGNRYHHHRSCPILYDMDTTPLAYPGLPTI